MARPDGRFLRPWTVNFGRRRAGCVHNPHKQVVENIGGSGEANVKVSGICRELNMSIVSLHWSQQELDLKSS